MESRASDGPRLTPVKIVVAGGFGVGKTTFVGAISEIEPLRSEAVMTQESAGIDELFEGNTKTTTTVAMDFGRISLKGNLVLYLFGTPGQDRFHFMWHELSKGAIGAVVLVDTRRLEACFPAVDFFEKQGVPFLVVVNTFNGEKLHSLDEVATALAINPSVPLLYCDARQRLQVQGALVQLVEHALTRALEGAAAP
ncbi:MAG TPA: ATP/GTP-binding protein [Acidimicrobiia bacterium]|nr:ATP/GTP-binding protein [Acidimicrobiia bacterium]